MDAWRNRIVGHGEDSPDNILANPSNARFHPRFQQEAMNDLLDEVGWVLPVTINKATGFLVDGHLRVELALKYEQKTIPVRYVDLTEREEAMVVAFLDAIGDLAETDNGKLDLLLDRVKTGSDRLAQMLEDLRTRQDVGAKQFKATAKATAELDAQHVKHYYDLKSANGYTQEQIERKRLSLEGVLVPVTAKWNEELLLMAGFRQLDCFWRYLNFAGWVAVK